MTLPEWMPLNTGFMRNPMNWVTVTLMVVIAMFAVNAVVEAVIRLRSVGGDASAGTVPAENT